MFRREREIIPSKVTESKRKTLESLRKIASRKLIVAPTIMANILVAGSPAMASEVPNTEHLKTTAIEQIATNISTREVRFSDVVSENPYHDAIIEMANRGIVAGFNDGTFGPEKNITRQQFTKMIDQTMGVSVTEDSWSDSNKPFDDLTKDDPYSLYPNDFVGEAYKNGITNGIKPREFGPYKNISRAQVITMIVKAAKNLMQERLIEPSDMYKSSMGNFSEAHQEFYRWGQYNCLLTGVENYDSWNPWKEASRGEVAQILSNLINNKGKTEKIPEFVEVDIKGGNKDQHRMVKEVLSSRPSLWSYIKNIYPNFFVRINYGGHAWQGYIDVNIEKTGKEFTHSVAHEFGHEVQLAADKEGGYPNLAEPWLNELRKRGYTDEKWVWNGGPPHYGKKNPWECFTENFVQALYSPFSDRTEPNTSLAVLSREEMIDFLKKNGVTP